MSEHDAPSAREWETALERLEVKLNRVERMGTAVEAGELDLNLPASLNTIPRYLLTRAQSLVERQQRLLGLLSDSDAKAARGGTLHERVGHLITGPREPVNFDLFGDSPDR